jgi:hypothetical protein
MTPNGGGDQQGTTTGLRIQNVFFHCGFRDKAKLGHFLAPGGVCRVWSVGAFATAGTDTSTDLVLNYPPRSLPLPLLRTHPQEITSTATVFDRLAPMYAALRHRNPRSIQTVITRNHASPAFNPVIEAVAAPERKRPRHLCIASAEVAP